MNTFLLARILVTLGLAVGLTSFSQTVSHIGDPDFLQVGGDVVDHSYYHFFREAGGDVAAMAVMLLFLHGPKRFRTREAWLMSLVVALGYYLPYWVGMPFNDALRAPNTTAEIAHVLQASLVLVGLMLAGKALHADRDATGAT